MVYLQGFFPLAAADHLKAIQVPKHCLKVVQWIGTDVWQLHRHFTMFQLKQLKALILDKIDVHLCNSEILRRELADVGIGATVVVPPLCVVLEATPAPRRFTVSAYFTQENPMHCMDLVMDIAKSMPDVRFLMFGGPLGGEKDKNIEHLGWRPIQEVIDQSSMNLRITLHDGWPQVPIQHLIAGRPAVCNFPLPFAHQVSPRMSDATYANDKASIIRAIRGVQEGKIEVDGPKAREHYMKYMDPVTYKHMIYKVLQRGKDFKPEDLDGAAKRELPTVPAEVGVSA